LTISGERKDHWEDSRGKVLVREMRYGAFRRIFQLPEGVGPEQVEAEFDKGLLRIRVKSVTKPIVPPSKIEVRSAEQTQAKTIEGRAAETETSGQ
jgi:HSP20 family protein